MEDPYKLSRFLDAQRDTYPRALTELKAGKKHGHYMWFIFPQLKGLGTSDAATYYGLRNGDEAAAYLDHPLLGNRLVEITTAVVQFPTTPIVNIVGTPDDLKFHACMTLFSRTQGAPEVFTRALTLFFKGNPTKKPCRS